MTRLGKTNRLRAWAGDRATNVAVWFFDLGHRLQPVDDGPRCPDCQIGPLLPDDEECPFCRDQQEAQERDRTVYDGGYLDGYSEAVQRYGDA